VSLPVASVEIQHEPDVVIARQRARQIAALVGFEAQDQSRIATAVSEIARNAFRYAGGGRAEFRIEGSTPPQLLVIRIADRGSGISNVAEVLSGRYRSETGMGIGISGARRLMDRFDLQSEPGKGTSVMLGKFLPQRAGIVTGADVGRIAAELVKAAADNPFEEIRTQNQELLAALEALRDRQEELERLNAELEDTNRGVVALYAELDDKADHLRRADEMKSRFLSNMSHEFRTPVNSIIALSEILLDRVDGELSEEQEKQVRFIRNSAQDLSTLVNDLLDIAKIEAGKVDVRPVEFEISSLFSALRGMLRPLLVNQSVSLVFEEPEGIPMLFTDEAKVSQIVRNFVSNALKFTERGVVTVEAHWDPAADSVVISVSDTGIGIAPEDQVRIFEEFTQLENPIQKRVKGTGLGLPLSRKLAELLGGALTVESALGAGSTFRTVIPRMFRDAAQRQPAIEPGEEADTAFPVLVVEDDDESALAYEKLLKGSEFRVIRARTVRGAREALEIYAPRSVILDILLRGEDTWRLLAELKENPATRKIPVIVATTVDDRAKASALGADFYANKPIEREWLLTTLRSAISRAAPISVLVVDDDEVARYILRRLLNEASFAVYEASNGEDALKIAAESRPNVIFLDLMMPGLSGYEVLAKLKSEERTRTIPVIIVTSKQLLPEEQRLLLRDAAAIVPKERRTGEIAAAAVTGALAEVGVVVRGEDE
jgi:signal transduction histidine kinase/CheY-like chemotaxis protein